MGCPFPSGMMASRFLDMKKSQPLSLTYQPIAQVCRKWDVDGFGDDSRNGLFPRVIRPDGLSNLAGDKHEPPQDGIEKPLPAQWTTGQVEDENERHLPPH